MTTVVAFAAAIGTGFGAVLLLRIAQAFVLRSPRPPPVRVLTFEHSTGSVTCAVVASR